MTGSKPIDDYVNCLCFHRAAEVPEPNLVGGRFQLVKVRQS
jgi:hypothetical protein